MTDAIELELRCPRCGYKFIEYVRERDLYKYKKRIFSSNPCPECLPQQQLDLYNGVDN